MTTSIARRLVLALTLIVAMPAVAPAAEGEMRWGLQRIQEQVVNIPIYDLAFLWGVGPRVEESGAGLIPGFAYSAPFEDQKLKK